LNFTDILLIIISSAGLLHGVAFAIHLSFFKKKNLITNYLLAFILVFMAFRIGKSVMLNFGTDLEPIFIFAGLAFLLLVGPLLRWYVLGMTRDNFKLPRNYFLELLPFVLVFIASFFIDKNWFENKSKLVVIVFGSALIFIYLHFAFYIFKAGRIYRITKNKYPILQQTKTQKSILIWLKLLLIGFVLIWISFFINLIENSVPYIIGPIMYSVVVYFLSFKAFQLKITAIDGNVFKKNDDMEVFQQITSLMVNDQLYLETTMSLSSISKLIGKSTQKTSEVINQYAKQNFNDFINYYRVQEAKKLLSREESKKFTISSIAFDVGFSSLSAFNSAFKKFENITPSAFRKTSD